MKTVIALSAVTLVALSLGTEGCAQAMDEEAASESTTAALTSTQQAGLANGTLELDEQDALDPMKAATAAATKPLVGFYPAGCAARTQDGTRVHIVFSDCTGPFGKVHLQGSGDLVFSKDGAGTIVVELTGGKDLTANGKALSYHAKGSLSFEGSKRRVVWHGESAGETKRGVAFDRVNDLDVLFDKDTRCVDAAGSSRGKIGKYELDLTVDDLSLCPEKCPTSGHVVATIAGPRKERTLEVTFDGSDRAKVKGLTGRHFEVQMACEETEAAE